MTADQMIKVSEIHMESDPARGNMVVLREKTDSDLFFIMFIGDSEFAAIAKEKGLVAPKRPLTHDLYLRIIEALPATFLRVEIHDIRDDTFYAQVVFRADGEDRIIDSRPSDAVALALNRKIPIYVSQKLFRRKLTPEEIHEYEGLVKSVKF